MIKITRYCPNFMERNNCFYFDLFISKKLEMDLKLTHQITIIHIRIIKVKLKYPYAQDIEILWTNKS